MNFDAAVVFVKNSRLHFCSDWLWPYCDQTRAKFASSIKNLIYIFPEPEPQFTKILLISGGPHETGKKTEIIDLSNPNSTCDTWPSYPKEVDGAFGALLGTTILICGGEG